MGTTIDRRIVEMKFDNQHFEKNVKTSLSTLDKLKKSLHFDGVSNGLNKLSKGFKTIDTSHLNNSIEKVRLSFTALDVAAATVFHNITNAVINTGKKLVDAFAIEPITTGFSEYELKMGSVQTIMASTGASLDIVNKYLDDLNTYSDKTIYSFSDMTNSIGKFTNAGVKLDDAVLAIKGISNEAAVSGANAQEASRAMYNFAQALSAGYVKLIDWKSIETANMATVEFKEELLKSAKAAGTVRREADGMYTVLTKNGQGSTMEQTISATKNFNDSLSYQWMTTEALIGTLRNYADETTEIGKKAFGAAQDVKTFTMMMDTLKEAAQSGWAQTWELIVGDFEEAKSLWTEASNIFGKMIDDSADSRNNIVEEALSSKWGIFTDRLEKSGIAVDDFQEKLRLTARQHGLSLDRMIKEEGSLAAVMSKGLISKNLIIEAIKKYSATTEQAGKTTEKAAGEFKNLEEAVKKVIGGGFGDGAERVKQLTEAGYDYAEVQDLVNKVLRGEKVEFDKLSDAQLKSAGLTKSQTEAFKRLAEEAEKTGTPLNELIASLEKPSGRQLLIDTLRNAIHNIVAVVETFRDAWNETFNFDANAESVYGMIEALHSFSETLKLNDASADKLRRSIKGLLSVFKILGLIAGGGINAALRLLTFGLNLMGVSILDVTAYVGDLISRFEKWAFESGTIKNAILKVVEVLKEAYCEFTNLPKVQNVIEKIGKGVEYLNKRFQEFVQYIKSFKNISLSDLETIFNHVVSVIEEDASQIREQFGDSKEMLKAFREDVKYYATSLGKDFEKIIDKMMSFALKVRETVGKHIGIEDVMTVGTGAGVIYIVKRLSDAIDRLADIIDFTKKIGDILTTLNKVAKSLNSVFKSFALKTKSEALLNLAYAIGVLSASLLALSFIDPVRLRNTAMVLGVLAAGLVALTMAMSKVGNISVDLKNIGSLVAMAAMLWLLVQALKKLEQVQVDLSTIGKLAAVFTMMTAMVGASIALSKFAPQASKGSVSMLAIGAALLEMVVVLKMLNGIDIEHPGKLITTLLGLVAGIELFSLVSRKIKFSSAAGMLVMVGAIHTLIDVFKRMDKIDPIKLEESADILFKIFAAFSLFALGNSFAGKNVAKTGIGILAMATALNLIIPAIKMIGNTDSLELENAANTIVKIVAIFGLVMALSNFAGQNAAKAGLMLLAMSGALVVLSGAIIVLTKIDDPSKLDNAVNVISKLMVIFGGIVAVSGLVKDCKGTIIAISVGVGLLSVALGLMASFVEPDRLRNASESLSLLIGAFAILTASTALVKKAYGTILVLTGVVAALAGVLYLLSKNNPESGMPAAIGLTVLLKTLSVSAVLLSKMGPVGSSAYAAIGVMTLVVGGLAVIIGALASFELDGLLETSASLSLLLVSLSASCAILGAAGKMGPSVLAGVKSMMVVVTALGGFMVALGALHTACPLMADLVDNGLPLLEKIAYSLGSFFGNIIGGFSAGVTSGLPKIGENLSEFMTNSKPFFDGAKNIEAKSVDGIKAIAEAILILSGASIVDGLASFLTGKNSLSEFGTSLADYAPSLNEYAKAVDGLDLSGVEPSANATIALANMASKLPNSGGALGDIVGNNDLGAFGEELSKFAPKLKEYANEVEGLVLTGVEPSANATIALANMASKLPNSGGFLGAIVGNNDLGTFGRELGRFAPELKKYAASVSGLDLSGVTPSANATLELVKMASEIPNEGGVLSWLAGDNSLSEFGSELSKFSKELAKYAENVSGIPFEGISPSVNATRQLITLANSIGNMGGVASLFIGDNTLGRFGNTLSEYAPKLKAYAENVTGIDSTAVRSSVNMTDWLIDAVTKVTSNDISIESAKGYNAVITSLGGSLRSYYTNVMDLDSSSIESAIDSTIKIIDMVTKMSSVNSEAATKFSTALTNLGNAGVKGFVSAFNNSHSTLTLTVDNALNAVTNEVTIKQEAVVLVFIQLIEAALTGINNKQRNFNSAGQALMTNFISGVKSKEGGAQNAFSPVTNSMITGINNSRSSFYNAGAYLVDGFVSGINDNAYKAENAASNMGSKAAGALDKKLKIHSPSKVAYRSGTFFGMGFILAILAAKRKAVHAAEDMGSASIDGLRNAIAKVKNSIENSVDTQPTIRPVLDLSNVKTGAKQISTMFNRTQAIDILASEDRTVSDIVLENNTGTPHGNVISFTQNNYSPKALSRIDIYRQTKNQISIMKGLR